MPIQDTAILETDNNIQDIPVAAKAQLSTSTKALEDFRALKNSFIDSYNTGSDIADGYLSYRGDSNKEAVGQRLSLEKAKLDSTTIAEEFEKQVLSDPEVFVEKAPLVVQAQEDTAERALDVTESFVDSVASPTIDSEKRDRTANQIKLWEMLEEATDEVSNLDYVKDIGLAFLPFRETINELQVFGSVFGNEEELESWVRSFKSLSIEEQQKRWPTIVEHFMDEFGPLKGGQALKNFLEPVAGKDVSDFSDWWKIVDVVDIAGVASTFAVIAAKLRGSMNLPKVLGQLENTEDGGEAVASALVSDEAADAMNIAKDSAFGDAVAFDTSTIDIAYQEELSSSAIAKIDTFFGQVDKTTEDIMTGNGYLRDGILNTTERAALEKSTMDSLSKAQHENIRIGKKTENTTQFTYQVRNEEGVLIDETSTLNMTRSNVGHFEQDQMSVLGEFLGSNTVLAKGKLILDVQTAQRMDSQTAKVFRDLTKLQTDAIAPLGSLLRPKNRRRLAAVEKALKEGDEFLNGDKTRGKIFDIDELKALYGLDEDQVVTYFNTNRLYNNLWRLRNGVKREEMIAFDYKQISLFDEEYSFGKNLGDAAAAKQSLRKADSTSLLDTVADEVIDNVTQEFLEEQYALGKTLVNLPDAYVAGAGRGRFNFVLVNAEDIRELPAVVLNRKKAYIPRIAKDGHYFVKEFGSHLINGEMKANQLVKTHRYFDNKADADKFTQQLRDKAVVDKKMTPAEADNNFKALEDREQEIIATATGSFSNGAGGLYTGARAQDDLLFGLEGSRGERLNPYEALSRNLASVARSVNINQWRLGMEQRWLNSADALLDVKIENFGELSPTIKSSRKGAFLNKTASMIRDWQGFPTREEQIYQAFTQRLYEWAKRRNLNTVAKTVGWMNSKDPIASARAMAFHSLLGWFNPVQLWVQAQGMSVAVSINLGKNLTKTLKDTTALTWLGTGNKALSRIPNTAKAAGMTSDELTEMYTLWKKTGYEDSILQTADHAASIRGQGINMTAISKASDNGLIFYRHGELLNRRMAFTTALDEFKTAKKGAKVSDDALKGIMDRANDLMLNLTRANRASWQKGIASVPTQFFQVSAKAMESMLGFNKNFTIEERLRILAGQIGLYGAAGVPLLGLGANYAMEYLGVTQQEIDNNPELVKVWNDGFWGFVTLGIFGADLEVSKRGSLVRGVTEFIDNWMYNESTIAPKMLGAFGATSIRFWDEFMDQIAPLSFGAYPTDIVDIGQIPIMPFLKSVSTWRSGEKALIMQLTGDIIDKHGNKVVEREFSTLEKVGTLIGFQTSDEARAYSLEERTQHVNDTSSRIGDLLIERMNDEIFRRESGTITSAFAEETKQLYAFVFGGLREDMKKKVRDNIDRRLGADTLAARAVKRYINTVSVNRVDSIEKIKAAMLGTPILSVLPKQEEE